MGRSITCRQWTSWSHDFGDPQKERIQFNENTLYSGEPETPKDINVASDLGHIRQLLNEGKNTEAGNIIQQKWIGRLNEAYQPFGDLYIEFASKGAITDYIHSLDMIILLSLLLINKMA